MGVTVVVWVGEWVCVCLCGAVRMGDSGCMGRCVGVYVWVWVRVLVRQVGYVRVGDRVV